MFHSKGKLFALSIWFQLHRQQCPCRSFWMAAWQILSCYESESSLIVFICPSKNVVFMLSQLDVKEMIHCETVKSFPHNAGHEAEMILCKSQFSPKLWLPGGEFSARAGDVPCHVQPIDATTRRSGAETLSQLMTVAPEYDAPYCVGCVENKVSSVRQCLGVRNNCLRA